MENKKIIKKIICTCTSWENLTKNNMQKFEFFELQLGVRYANSFGNNSKFKNQSSCSWEKVLLEE